MITIGPSPRNQGKTTCKIDATKMTKHPKQNLSVICFFFMVFSFLSHSHRRNGTSNIKKSLEQQWYVHSEKYKSHDGILNVKALLSAKAIATALIDETW